MAWLALALALALGLPIDEFGVCRGDGFGNETWDRGQGASAVFRVGAPGTDNQHMSDPSGSPSERQAPGASSPDTAPRPAQFQRVEERLHSRCGTHHRPNCCVIPMIKGIGPVIRAGLPGLCPICSIDIVYQGETEERDQIMAFMDFGYVHRDCVAQLLKPYHGPQAKPIAERMNEALAGESAPIVEYIVRARGGALEYSAYEISKAAPGAGKTKVQCSGFTCAPATPRAGPGAAEPGSAFWVVWTTRPNTGLASPRLVCAQVLAINAAVLGPLKCLNVAYNVDASLTLRARGAINSHTMHSLGMRAISRCVKESIKDRRLCVPPPAAPPSPPPFSLPCPPSLAPSASRLTTLAGPSGDVPCRSKEFSSYDAPPNLQLSLISEGKTLLLISYMHPPGEDDGLNAKVSLIFKVFGTFVQALYEAATTRAFGIGGRPGMSDVASLSKLAFELHLSTKFIVPALGRLNKPEMQRLNAVCNTATARVSAACMMIAEVHTASLTAMTNPIWYVNGNKVLHLVHPITGVSHRLPCCSYNEQVRPRPAAVWASDARTLLSAHTMVCKGSRYATTQVRDYLRGARLGGRRPTPTWVCVCVCPPSLPTVSVRIFSLTIPESSLS